MTHCPTCNTLLDRSTTLIDGVTVLRCKPCREFRIDGDTEVFKRPDDPIKALRLRAYQLDLIKIDQEAAESPWEDPRWERIS